MAARARQGVKRGPSEGNRHRLLDLTSGYRALAPDDPGGFGRPGPPPAEPLPLKFTCAKCGETVHHAATQCSRCREWFSLPNSRNRRFKR